MSETVAKKKNKKGTLQNLQEKFKENREKERHKKVKAGEAPFVDLVPPLYKEERTEENLKYTWKRICILIVIITALAIAAAVAWRYLAYQEYDGKTAEGTAVEEQVQEYSEVNALLSEVNALEASITNSMSSEVDWYPILVDVENSLPSSTNIETITVETGGNTETGEVIASVRMTLVSTDPLDYANTAESLPNAVQTDLGNLTSGGGTYNFTLSFGVGESALAYNFVDPPGSEFLDENDEFSFEDFNESQDMDDPDNPDFNDEPAPPEEGDF